MILKLKKANKLNIVNQYKYIIKACKSIFNGFKLEIQRNQTILNIQFLTIVSDISKLIYFFILFFIGKNLLYKKI